jgi:hypothetical protein
MARQKGIIKMDGSLGGITFYKMSGEYMAKKATGPDRESIYREEKYAGMRENMQEFGGASTIGKTFRQTLQAFLPVMRDPHITGRLTKLFKDVIIAGHGKKGERYFSVLPYGKLLTGFEFSKNYFFDSFCRATHLPCTVDAGRKTQTLVYPKFDAGLSIASPKGSTHFQLFRVSVLLSDYFFCSDYERYVAKEPNWNGKMACAFSDVYGKKEKLTKDVILTAHFEMEEDIPITVSVVMLSGILFYQEIDGAYYEFSEGNALKIDGVV